MQKLNPEIPFTSARKDEANEGARISVRDPDTILTTIVLLPAWPSRSWRMQSFSNASGQPQGYLLGPNTRRSNDAGSNNVAAGA